MTGNPTNAGKHVAELALQLGRVAYGDYPADGLTPTQWTALRFFAEANRFSRTVSAFAEFHATTRGTASQTVKSLVTRGYLQRTRSPRDGRSVHFDLTPLARRTLASDPFHAIVRAAGSLSATQQSRMASGLTQLLKALALERGRGLTGRCALCGHLRGAAGGFRCELMGEPLAEAELGQLCMRFLPRP